MNIPLLDSFGEDVVECIKTGQFVTIENDEVSVDE